MEKILELLQELHPEVDFETCTTLIDDSILDSLDIVTIISELSLEFDIEIPPQEIIPSNFNSAQALYEMVKKLS